MLNFKKSVTENSLYVAQQAFSYEHILQHCLWKLLSETGFLYHEELTEMESIILARFVNKKYNSTTEGFPVDPQQALTVLNSAIDKVLVEVKELQLKGQKYGVLALENQALKNGLRGLIKESLKTDAVISTPVERSVEDIGLSKRTVRILKSTGIDTLQKLRSCSLFRLQNQQRVGVKTIHEIQTALSKYSVHPLND